MLLLCGVPVLVASIGCCASATLWMIPNFLANILRSDGFSWLGWALIYGTLGGVGLLIAWHVLGEARTLGRVLDDGSEADLVAWAGAYGRTIRLLAVGGSLASFVVLGGALLMCAGLA